MITRLREDESPLSIHVYNDYDRFQTRKECIIRKPKERCDIVSKASNYEAKTESLILPILERLQFELVDVEYVKEGSIYYLRAYIDKEGGITVNDCEVVAREMNDLLDKEDFIPESYTFEVSSPGLGRPLKKEKDYVRNMGKEVEIRTYRAINRNKEFYGLLTAYDKDSVTIDADGEEMRFEKADIALIRQAVHF